MKSASVVANVLAIDLGRNLMTPSFGDDRCAPLGVFFVSPLGADSNLRPIGVQMLWRAAFSRMMSQVLDTPWRPASRSAASLQDAWTD